MPEYIIAKLTKFLLTVPIVLISLTVHEVSHGYAAYKLGDTTAKDRGRLSLNPLRHLDPMGALCMLFFGYGWARPVPINCARFKNPKAGMAITAFAGPLSNFIMAAISLFLFMTLGSNFPDVDGFALNFLSVTLTFLQLFYILNISLCIFNLIPIPPLDGSRILLMFLPQRQYFQIMRYERIIMLVLLACLWIGLLDRPLALAVNGITYLLESLYLLLPFINF